MYADKTLWVYDEVNKEKSQLTTNKVVDFYIYDGILYFNQVTNLVNNDLYSVGLISGGETKKINTNDVRNLYSDGNFIYGTHYNWAGLAGGIFRMKMDGSEYVKFSEINGAKNFKIKDGKLYFVNCSTGQDNGSIEYIDVNEIDPSIEKLNMKGTNLSKNIKNVKQFSFDGNDIFYAYNGTINNSIRRTDFTTLSEGVEIASKATNPMEFILNGNYVYYYSYPSTSPSKAGFYRVSKTATADGTQELILGYENAFYATSLSISESGYMYFLNYVPKLLLGNARFYQLNLISKEVARIS